MPKQFRRLGVSILFRSSMSARVAAHSEWPQTMMSETLRVSIANSIAAASDSSLVETPFFPQGQRDSDIAVEQKGHQDRGMQRYWGLPDYQNRLK